MKSKGQITIFVIIGLILLLGVALVYFLTRVSSVNEPGFDTNDVSLETRPAQQLITSCLSSTLTRGLRTVGAQGGSLNPPSVQYPSYRGGSVLYEPYAVPYWRYLDDCGYEHGCEFSNKPPLCSDDTRYCAGLEKGTYSIESSLENFIVEEIETCIDGFSSISELYDIEKTGEEIEAEVIFAEGSTRAVLRYPIILRSFSTDDTQTLDVYEAEVDINLLEMYALAQEIIEFAKESNYYERQTMQVLSVYADVNREDAPLPPVTSVTFFDTGHRWILSEVQETLESQILPFMSLIRFANTANGYPLISETNNEYTQYVNGWYRSFLPVLSDVAYDFNVYHHYIYDPIFVSVGDGEQLIEPREFDMRETNPLIRGITSFFSVRDYSFEYDISYPLIISIEDEDALNGEGFSFDFAYEVNVRNNQPGYQNFTILQSFAPISRGLGDFRVPITHEFITTDKHTGEALEDVLITYVCGNEFSVGTTELINDRALLRAQLPPCQLGGYVRYQKDGYLGEAVPFNNVESISNQTFNLELWPVKEREIIIRKRSLSDIQTIVNAASDGLFAQASLYTNISENDSVILTVERTTRTAYDTPVPLVGFIRYDNSTVVGNKAEYTNLIQSGLESGFYTQEEADELLEALDVEINIENIDLPNTMEFVPGNFTLSATLIDKVGMYLPAETIEGDSDGLASLFVDTDVDLEAENFTQWLTGGLELTLSLTEDDVYRDTPIILYVLELPKPTSWSELIEKPPYTSLLPVYVEYLVPELR